MVKLTKIYTRTGDDGTTGLVGGERIAKDGARIHALGEIDELNAVLGICRTMSEPGSRSPQLEGNSGESSERIALSAPFPIVQQELFDIGAEIATPPGCEWPTMAKMSLEQISRLETWIDAYNAELPELRSFVLPGGTPLNAQLHLARTVCRRAERSLIHLSKSEPISPQVIAYVNRLSDLLFVMARVAVRRAGAEEFLWVPGATAPGK